MTKKDLKTCDIFLERHASFFVFLIPTRSEERGVLGLGVFLLQYSPLVNI